MNKGISESLRIATWNVRGIANKEIELEKQLFDMAIDIAILSETKKKLKGTTQLGKYIMIYSGVQQQERASAGVAILIKEKYKNRIISYSFINERIVTLRMKVERGYMTIIAIYAPEEGRKEKTIEFYEILQQIITQTNKNDYQLVIGDYNARVGNNPIHNIIGTEGEQTLNQNGHRLIEFAGFNELRITNTFYRHRNIHKYTWSARGSASLIDYILANKKTWALINDVRAYRGPDISTDHFLVISKIRLPKRWIQNITKLRNNIETFKVHLLQDKSISNLYQTRINKYIKSIPTSNNINKEWTNIKQIMTTAAYESLGKRKKKYTKRGLKIWDEEINQLIEEKKEIYLKTLKTPNNLDLKMEYKRKSALVKKKVRDIKRQSWEKYISDLEYDLHGRQDKAYKIIKELNKEERDTLRINPISEKEWLNYFKQLWTNNEDTDIPMEPVGNVDQIDMLELEEVIKDSKNKKSAGTDGLNMELIKYASTEFKTRLLDFINLCWQEGYVPDEWNEAYICPIYKRGDRTLCNNYRGISLLNSCYKIYAKIIGKRLRPIMENKILEAQHGFRKGRSCSDCIFTITQLIEKRREQNLPTYFLFVDYHKAFDKVRRTLLWEILKKKGIPKHLIRAIQSLYRENIIKIRTTINGKETAFINQGVRQGCPLSPTLFNFYIDEVINEWLKNLNRQFIINNTNFTTLLFADDQIIIGSTEDSIQEAIYKLNDIANRYNMTISIEKTKTMAFKGNEPIRAKIVLNNKTIEQVNGFNYLGYKISYTRSNDLEIKLNRYRYFCGTIARTLKNKVRKETIIKLYKTMALPTLLYGSECWTLTKDQMRRIESTEMKFLRNIAGYTLLDHIKSETIRKKLNITSTNEIIKQYRENWKNHITRMPEERITRIALNYNPKGRRNVGRPLRRWREQF